eukprot:Seg21996.1 transcript_id=Seg21996.1/GoldUCD/mRNA.D3Y31 product="ABC transporter ATP-binding protein NatA" protein_id=Seg21996.1/GoldUCD/D3Y31
MIEVQQVSKTYLGSKEVVRAVDNVSFRCEAGRVFALLGPNGSGKTTLLRMISTMLQPDTGEVFVAGFDTRKNAEDVRKHLGFLTGSAGLHEKLSGRETLAFFGKLYGLSDQEVKKMTEELTDRFELSEFIDRPTGKLSMGQKQRVMIARTLIHNPDVVVFDEATTGLDVLAAKGLIDLIRHCRSEGKTVLFSTHIMGEVAMLADDVSVLYKGQQIYSGSFAELKANQQAASIEDEFVRILEQGGAA